MPICWSLVKIPVPLVRLFLTLSPNSIRVAGRSLVTAGRSLITASRSLVTAGRSLVTAVRSLVTAIRPSGRWVVCRSLLSAASAADYRPAILPGIVVHIVRECRKNSQDS